MTMMTMMGITFQEHFGCENWILIFLNNHKLWYKWNGYLTKNWIVVGIVYLICG
jgi:hypothetical protein